MAGSDHLDEVLAEVGYGRWQVPIVVLSLASKSPPWQSGPRCHILPSGVSIVYHHGNFIEYLRISDSYDFDIDGFLSLSAIQMNRNYAADTYPPLPTIGENLGPDRREA